MAFGDGWRTSKKFALGSQRIGGEYKTLALSVCILRRGVWSGIGFRVLGSRTCQEVPPGTCGLLA